MMTEKIRVRHSSVMRSVDETRAIPARWRAEGAWSGIMARVYHRPMSVLRGIFLFASCTWAAALPLSTLVASMTRTPATAFGFAFVIYAMGGLVCHQRPERSFWLWGAQMPVCARCSGIYAGAALAAALALIIPGSGSRTPDGEPRFDE